METIFAAIAAIYALAVPPVTALPSSDGVSTDDIAGIVTATALVGGYVGYTIPHPSHHADAVPEPAAVVVLGLGVGSLLRRRKR